MHPIGICLNTNYQGLLLSNFLNRYKLDHTYFIEHNKNAQDQ